MVTILLGSDIYKIRHNATLRTPLSLIIPRIDIFYDGETAHGYGEDIMKSPDKLEIDNRSSKMHLFLYDYMQWDIQLVSAPSSIYQTILYKMDPV